MWNCSRIVLGVQEAVPRVIHAVSSGKRGHTAVADGPSRIDLGDNLLGTPSILPAPTFGQKGLCGSFDRRFGPPFSERSTQGDQLIRHGI
jgi:hypothetical protein